MLQKASKNIQIWLVDIQASLIMSSLSQLQSQLRGASDFKLLDCIKHSSSERETFLFQFSKTTSYLSIVEYKKKNLDYNIHRIKH